jgi:hypothetical protein
MKRRAMTEQVHKGVARRLREQGAMDSLSAFFFDLSGPRDITKCRRIELLDMNNDQDRRRWQVLHNDAERYEVLNESEKMAANGDYLIRIIYYEKGSNLPIYKSAAELRKDDERAEAQRVLNSDDDEALTELFAFDDDD